jgi:hypothetical protein
VRRGRPRTIIESCKLVNWRKYFSRLLEKRKGCASLQEKAADRQEKLQANQYPFGRVQNIGGNCATAAGKELEEMEQIFCLKNNMGFRSHTASPLTLIVPYMNGGAFYPRESLWQ